MQITRDNYSQYANMVQQMFGNRKNSNDPLAQCDYGNFALRFKPVDTLQATGKYLITSI